MSINNYPYDVAFVRNVDKLTTEDIALLEGLGLIYYTRVAPERKHLQVWCGGFHMFGLVPSRCIDDALDYEQVEDRPHMFFDSVTDLVQALSP